MRSTADGIVQQWDKLATDTALRQAVSSANKVAGTKLKLSPSPAFVTAEKKLQSLEHTVLSESIPLAHEDGGLWVTVVIDGKHTRKMVVDSGATTVSLPFSMAKELGLEPTSQDQRVIVGLADGSQVPATKINIRTVRVGKFSVDDVDCIVLDREAVNAPALLGMSFLGNFKFEVDKQKSELRMTKVDAGDVGTKPKTASDAAAKKKK